MAQPTDIAHLADLADLAHLADPTLAHGAPPAAPGSGAPRHLSLIRSLHLADAFTIANGVCGTAAILEAVRFAQTGSRAHLAVAVGLLPLAMLLDLLDGRVARARGTPSALGKEMDSLADLVSFGVAPAAIAFAAGLDRGLDVLALLFFVTAGLTRLARYNVTSSAMADAQGKVSHFEGTPITFGFVPTALVVVLAQRVGLGALPHVPLHAAALLFVASGCLMMSKTLRVPKP